MIEIDGFSLVTWVERIVHFFFTTFFFHRIAVEHIYKGEYNKSKKPDCLWWERRGWFSWTFSRVNCAIRSLGKCRHHTLTPKYCNVYHQNHNQPTRDEDAYHQILLIIAQTLHLMLL